ncbi:MAG: hypothetical protein GY870_01815 [archaeon]|nr:hypothetical protein [archaeon]
MFQKLRQKIELPVLIVLIPISIFVFLNSNIGQYEVFDDSGNTSSDTITIQIEPGNQFLIIFSIHNDNCYIDLESTVEFYFEDRIIKTMNIIKTNDDEYSEYVNLRISPLRGDSELVIVFENTNVDRWKIKIYKNIPWYKEELFVITMVSLPILIIFDFGFSFMEIENKKK